MPVAIQNVRPPAIYLPLSGEEAEGQAFTPSLEKIRRAVGGSVYWRALEAFVRAESQLMEFSRLAPDWDSYGAEPPNATAMDSAAQLLGILRSLDLPPTRVVPSSEGGVGICFVNGKAYADIESLNSGELLAVMYSGAEEPQVWEITQNEESIREAVEQIRGHLTSLAPRAYVSTQPAGGSGVRPRGVALSPLLAGPLDRGALFRYRI